MEIFCIEKGFKAFTAKIGEHGITGNCFSFFVCFFCLSWELLQHVCNLMAMIQKKGKFLFQEITNNCRQNCFSYQKGWNSASRCRRSLKGAGIVHPLKLEELRVCS